MYKGHLGLSLANGPDWITGGIVGPEGSVLSFIQLGGLIPIALWYCIRTKQTPVMSVALPRRLRACLSAPPLAAAITVAKQLNTPPSPKGIRKPDADPQRGGRQRIVSQRVV